MRKKFFIITAFSIIFLTNIGLTSVFAEPLIEQILFNSSTTNLDQLIFKMNGPYLPKTFALKGDRPRVVFDFVDVVPGKKIQNTIQADGTFIKQIRTGMHKGDKPKTRIVLDLQPEMDIDFSQDFNKDTNTLVISIFPAGMPPEKAVPVGEKPKAAEEKIVPAAEPPAERLGETGVEKLGRAEAVQPGAERQEAAVETAPPVAAPETKTMAPAAEIQPQQETAEAETAKTASVPPAESKGLTKPELEESTVIRPLSEIGKQEKAARGDEKVPTLSAVNFDNTSHRGEIVSFKLNGFNPPVVFGIEEEIPRIVCFFKDTSSSGELAESIETNGKFIKSIKIGKYRNPDNVRVVLDLVPGKNYDLQQIFFKEDNLFMVIINTTGDKVVN